MEGGIWADRIFFSGSLYNSTLRVLRSACFHISLNTLSYLLPSPMALMSGANLVCQTLILVTVSYT